MLGVFRVATRRSLVESCFDGHPFVANRVLAELEKKKLIRKRQVKHGKRGYQVYTLQAQAATSWRWNGRGSIGKRVPLVRNVTVYDAVLGVEEYDRGASGAAGARFAAHLWWLHLCAAVASVSVVQSAGRRTVRSAVKLAYYPGVRFMDRCHCCWSFASVP